MRKKIISSSKTLSVLFCVSVAAGCASMQSTLNCPDDPFDPNASGACRLFYTKQQQQGRLDTESGKTAGLEADALANERDNNAADQELASLDAEVSRLRADFKVQESRTLRAERLLADAKSSGSKSTEELVSLNSKLADIKSKLSLAGSSTGSSREEVDRLTKLRTELEKELDVLLTDL